MPDTPWYATSNWDYVKGNLSSVDRNYAPFNGIIHNIGTHQIHHLFPAIPHYKLVEATKHFVAAYPHLHRKEDSSLVLDFINGMYLWIRYGHDVPDDQLEFTYTEEIRRAAAR
eukprot:NODE_1467_length_537_cov_120.219262_g1390_i0.p2 GENE.NODE_1467_length_537_cov_120.219262_g1390_i0~~NODE_1467_length_537_cov_120.219262_g1390_i0.p2  ORF type:complete len:123 (+),score=33.86 NODE_1467_length_537_cov_120.219262_g1390_i0:31-369(+)